MNNIHKLYLFSFINSMAFFGAVSIPFFLYWAKLSYVQIFTLEAAYMLLIFLLEVPTGIVADRFGRKNSLFLSALAWTGGLLIFGTIPNFFALLVGEAAMALGAALLSGADKALLYDSLKEMKKTKDSKHFFSRFLLFDSLGVIVAFPIGSMIAGSSIVPYPQTLPLTFLLAAIPVSLSALIALSIKEPKRKFNKENFLLLGIKGIKYFFKHKALRSFGFDMALISSTTFFIYWLYQPILLNAGTGIGVLGFAAAGFNIFAIILLAKIKKIENFIGTKRILFFSALVPALVFLLLSFFKPLWFALIGIFIIFGLRAVRGPLFDSYMNKHIKSGNRATVLSAISMLQRAIMIVLYPIVGFLTDISLSTALLVLGMMTLIFAVFAKVDEKHMKK